MRSRIVLLVSVLSATACTDSGVRSDLLADAMSSSGEKDLPSGDLASRDLGGDEIRVSSDLLAADAAETDLASVTNEDDLAITEDLGLASSDFAAGADATAPSDLVSHDLLPDPACSRWVAASGGADDAAGTSDDPLATIYAANLQVAPGCTIWLLDGTHSIGMFVNVRAGVAIRAVNPGMVTLTGGATGPLLNFPSGGSLDGIINRMSGIPAGIAVGGGTLTITRTQADLSTVINGYAFFVAQGTGKLVFNAPSPQASWCATTCDGAFAYAEATGGIEVNGGRLEGWTNPYALIVARDSSTITITGVTFLDNPTKIAAILLGSSVNTFAGTLTITGSRFANTSSITGAAIYVGWGTPTLTISNTIVEDNLGAAIFLDGAVYPQHIAQTLTISLSTIDQNRYGIFGGTHARPVLAVVGTSITRSLFDAIAWKGTYDSSISMSSSTLTNNLGSGISLSDSSTAAHTLHVRATTIRNNASDGIDAAGAVGTTINLGTDTGAEAGNNEIAHNGVGGSGNANLRTSVTTATTFAVGNTWTPGLDGADESGHYLPSTTHVGPKTTGANTRLTTGAQINL